MLKNTKKTMFYDPIVESGHIEFNQLFMLKFDNPIYVCSKINENSNYLKYHLKSICNHYKFLNKAIEGDVFLAFNNLSLFLVTFFFKEINCSFVVHNNLDFAAQNKIHKFFYKRIAKKVNLIYLENRLEYQGRLLSKHKFSYIISHPIINIKSNNFKIKNQVFVSGRNLTSKQLKYVCEAEKICQVICNTTIDNVFSDNLKMGFIDNFDEMLSNCKKIYIIGSYQYRASGILYKALSLDSVEIIFSEKTYFKEILNLKSSERGNNKISINEQLR